MQIMKPIILAAGIAFSLVAQIAEADEVTWDRKWAALQDSVQEFSRALPLCNTVSCLVFRTYSGTQREIITKVNFDVNLTITYLGEGSVDNWQRPAETLKLGTGDCEDYAILKIAILRAYGIDARFTVVDTGINVKHAVAIAPIDGKWYILDSQHSELIETSKSPKPLIYTRGVQTGITGSRK
jgi:predicted transglutaminase-like cysteine proteinase